MLIGFWCRLVHRHLINQQGKLVYTTPDAPATSYLAQQLTNTSENGTSHSENVRQDEAVRAPVPEANAVEYSDLLAQSLQTQRGIFLLHVGAYENQSTECMPVTRIL